MKYLSKLLSMLLIGAMLWTTACTDYDEDIRDLNNKIDDIHSSLMDDQIDPLKADLEQTKQALEDAIDEAVKIKAKHEEDIKVLQDADKKLTKDLEDAIKNANDAIDNLESDMNTALDGVKKDIDNLTKTHEQDIKDLEAVDTEIKNDLETLSGKVVSNYNELKALVDANTKDIDAVKELLNNHISAFDAYKTEVDAAIAILNSKVATLEEATNNLKNRVDGIDKLLADHKTLIDTNAQNIDKLSKHVDEVYNELTKADEDLEDLIATTAAAIRGELSTIENKFDDEFIKAYGEIGKNTTAINKLRSEYEDHVKDATARFETIEKVQGEHTTKIAALETDLANYKKTVETEFEKVRDELQKAADKALADAKAYADEGDAAVTAAYKEAISKEATAIRTELAQAVTDLTKKLEDLKTELVNLINAEVEKINNKLAALIQNITFVPEYADGKATAVRVLGPQSTTLSATTLTAVFEVTPASAAEALKTNGFVVVEPVKTRGEALKGERLAVEVIDAAAGRVKVTAFVHNMPADYDSYAFTLNVEAENKVVASSDYVYIHENADAQYKFVYVTEADNKTIEEHPNWDTTLGRLVFNTKWTKAAEAAINFTEGYVYKLADDNGFYNIDEIEAKHGLAADAMTVLSKVTSTGDVDAFTIKNDTLVDMVSESEYDMYAHIGKMITLKVEALNDWGWDFSFEADFNITGVNIENNTYHIEEAGDLYWLSNNPHYSTNTNNTTVEFLAGVEIDMAGYCTDGVAAGLAPYAPVSNLMETITTINGNGATVKNLTVEGVESIGMFGYVKGNISGLTVTNAVVKGNHWVGAIAGKVCGAIKDCHVAESSITATPDHNGAWDNGDKVGGIVGYSEPNTVPGVSHAIENCSVVNTNVTGFRDLAGIVGATYYGDNLKNNKVENVNVLAIQREFLNPGYNADEYGAKTFIGRVLGRDLNNTYAWTAAGDGANTVSGEDLRIRYAVGAEVNATPVDVAQHTLELSTANGLAWFSNHVVDKVYYTFQNVIFVEDLDFEGKVSFADDDVTFKPINNWEGTLYRSFNFDGQNKTVKNFVLNNTNEKDLGLFGSYVGDIKNVKMENVTLLGLGRVAPIATQLWGNVDNCHVTNLVAYANVKAGDDGDKVGGIVGQMQESNTITNCSVSKADIMGYRNLGGIAGHANIASWDDSNKLSEVTIWINQVAAPYGSYVPFDTESAYVGRQEGTTVALNAEGVEVYNILNADLDRRYVETRGKQLRLGYDLNVSPVAAVLKENSLSSVYSNTENGLALYQFAVDYASYQDVFQVTEMALTSNWTAIGTDFASAFVGVYDGNNKTIEGLQIVNPLETPSGLFGFVRGNIKNVNMVNPIVYGSHWAAAVAAVMYGTVEGCTVDGGEVILMPNHNGDRFDNGDKAAAIVGYLAANGAGDDKILNNKVSNIKVKGYRDVAVLVGCANNIDEMSGNTITNCAVIVDQITGKYPADDPKDENIGLLIGRLDNDTVANVKNNTIDAESSLNRVSGVNNEIVKILDAKEIGNK